jgi:CRISPR-associated protein Cas1
MATLYIDRNHLRLRLERETLVIEGDQTPARAIPLSLLRRVVVQATISVSTALLAELGARDVSFVVINRRNARAMARLAGPCGQDAARRLAQYQRALDPAWSLRWSARLLTAKLRAQRRFLAEAAARRAELRHPMTVALQTVDDALQQIQQGNTPGLDHLMGLEGAAAAACFRAYSCLFPPSLGYHGRNRRPPRDPVNACLSLAYTLCHHEAVARIHEAGLDPFIGFLHAPAHGRESLACDLVEPLRPRVDSWVWYLFRERRLRAEHFQRLRDGRCLLGKAGRRIFYEEFETAQRNLSRHLRRLCLVLLRNLSREFSDQTYEGRQDPLPTN